MIGGGLKVIEDGSQEQGEGEEDSSTSRVTVVLITAVLVFTWQIME